MSKRKKNKKKDTQYGSFGNVPSWVSSALKTDPEGLFCACCGELIPSGEAVRVDVGVFDDFSGMWEKAKNAKNN